MSQKSKVNRANRNIRQEKQGKKVIAWIIGCLIVLAIIYSVVMSVTM